MSRNTLRAEPIETDLTGEKAVTGHQGDNGVTCNVVGEDDEIQPATPTSRRGLRVRARS